MPIALTFYARFSAQYTILGGGAAFVWYSVLVQALTLGLIGFGACYKCEYLLVILLS